MGSFYFNKIYSNSNEIDFMNLVVDFILSIDSRITCDTTVAEQYDSSMWEEGTEHVPTFNFIISNKIDFQLKRENTLAGNDLALIIGHGTDYRSGTYFSSAWHNGGVYQNLYRELNISALVNDTFILFSFGGMAQYGTAGFDCVWFTSNDKNYTNFTWGRSALTIASIFDISGKTFTELETSASGTFVSKFPYNAPSGEIDFSRGAAYVNGGYEVFNSSVFIDCTKVTVGDTVALANGAYFAVGPHQLVKIIDN